MDLRVEGQQALAQHMCTTTQSEVSSSMTSIDCDCEALQARIRELEAQVASQQEAMRLQRTQNARDLENRLQQSEQANQGLQQENNNMLKQSSNMLKHFACMSHEIRTPLVSKVLVSSFHDGLR